MELPGEDIELQELSPPQGEDVDESEWETPFDWSPDFERFMSPGPRQFYGVDPINHSYKTVHARSAKRQNTRPSKKFFLNYLGEFLTVLMGTSKHFFLTR